MHLVFRVQAADISIHALREEGDARPIPPLVCVTVFLSTPSARRATFLFPVLRLTVFYFYPRPPRGGRHTAFHERLKQFAISIHALREEGDPD